MTDPSPPVRQDARLAVDPGAAAALVEPLMTRAAGEGTIAVSLALDYAAHWAAGEPVTAEAWVEQATRTLVFVHARVSRAADGTLLAGASMVFRRVTAATSAT